MLGESPAYWVVKLPRSEDFSSDSRGTKPLYCRARDAPRVAKQNLTFSVPARPMLPRICGFEGPTVFVRLNAAACIKFSAYPMRRLYKGGVCFEITFLKSLTTVTVNRFFLNIMYFKGSSVSLILQR